MRKISRMRCNVENYKEYTMQMYVEGLCRERINMDRRQIIRMLLWLLLLFSKTFQELHTL